jgi:hypothetical protein
MKPQRENEPKLAEKTFKYAIGPPRKWLDCATQAHGSTGTEPLVTGCTLHRKNPRAKGDIAHLTSVQLAAPICAILGRAFKREL